MATKTDRNQHTMGTLGANGGGMGLATYRQSVGSLSVKPIRPSKATRLDCSTLHCINWEKPRVKVDLSQHILLLFALFVTL
jgi:hypothetical protein